MGAGWRVWGGAWGAGLLLVSFMVSLAWPAAARASAGPPACSFVLGFKALRVAAASTIGACRDNQQFAANGNAQQLTSKGLLVWRKADNWTAFTNGYMTWIAGPHGLVSRFNDEWFEWEAYPAQTHDVAVTEQPPAPPSPSEVSLGSLIHVDQSLNNCGPAAVAEVLRYYGLAHSQQELRGLLRPEDPSGMVLGAIAPVMHGLGLSALVRYGGSEALVKALVRAHLPTIVEQTVSQTDGQLHYRAIEGYDDAQQHFLTADPLLGPRRAISYAAFDRLWAPTHHTWVLIYPRSRQASVNAALAVAG
ncbi:MAG: C39 family peptidase [Chloroflexota bacterium]